MPTLNNINIGKLIDVTVVNDYKKSEKRRGHLGASIIGHKCYRYLWFVLHWASFEELDAKQIRLFERGSLEEFRFEKWLRGFCEEVFTIDPRTKKQIKIKDFNGIFSGSCDGVAKLNGQWFVTEFKTHGDKSFKELKKLKSIYSAKRMHYDQMQTYMRKLNKDWGLYIGINKNTDEIYWEWVEHNMLESDILLSKAETVINTVDGIDLPRLSENPTWFECAWCEMRPVCHKDVKPEKNCRTCSYSRPKEDNTWECLRHCIDLSIEDQQDMLKESIGYECPDWTPHAVFANAFKNKITFDL